MYTSDHKSWFRFINKKTQMRKVLRKKKNSCKKKFEPNLKTNKYSKPMKPHLFWVRHWHFVFMLTQSSATFGGKQDRRNKSLRAIKAAPAKTSKTEKTQCSENSKPGPTLHIVAQLRPMIADIQRHTLTNSKAIFFLILSIANYPK